MRLDKYLAHAGLGTRTEVKKMIKQGIVMVDDVLCMDPGFDVAMKEVTVNGQTVDGLEVVYFMMNKPAGVVSAKTDYREQTVFDLLGTTLPHDVQIVGRLDKDSTGLLLLTNDGELTHKIIGKHTHVKKEYIVELVTKLNDSDIRKLESGIILDDKKTKPITIEPISDHKYTFTLAEGRYHQIKRMAHHVANEVRSIHRSKIGPIRLDPFLAEGKIRPLTSLEIEELKNATLRSVE